MTPNCRGVSSGTYYSKEIDTDFTAVIYCGCGVRVAATDPEPHIARRKVEQEYQEHLTSGITILDQTLPRNLR